MCCSPGTRADAHPGSFSGAIHSGAISSSVYCCPLMALVDVPNANLFHPVPRSPSSFCVDIPILLCTDIAFPSCMISTFQKYGLVFCIMVTNEYRHHNQFPGFEDAKASRTDQSKHLSLKKYPSKDSHWCYECPYYWTSHWCYECPYECP